MCTVTLFVNLFLLSYSYTHAHSSTSTTHPSHFYLKNTDYATSFTKQERFKKRRINMIKHRKKMLKNMQQSPSFSVMLPKGFVPPSGSSPCHNDQPNSMSSSFHCHLSATAQQP
ncbi:hypothetical protein VNO78_04054 [Psophocarpus tetragonolobus]|uniref:Uncharacterized protein n=1 Tax=Psophocarpus tetragonolobus TaxID=3891 RepID=A0AAN9T1I4_PSOTE